MSSVYFPAHVVVLFKRLVNVVSTLSISTQCVRQTRSDDRTAGTPIGSSGGGTVTTKDSLSFRNSYNQLRNIEWLRWIHLNDAEGGYGKGNAGGDNGMVLKAAISLPSWTQGWSNYFLTPQTESSGSSFNDPPPPTMYPKSAPEKQPPRREPPKIPDEDNRPPDVIHQLIANPALLDPIRTPRYPIVLCHGLYGFDSRGPSTFPSMRMHYWSNVLKILRGMVGAEVIITSVPGTGSISARAMKLDEQLQLRARGRGINFLAHSMGGLDCRHLISHIRPYEYAPLSLTSISTPHRGSPFMDWCQSNIGIGKLRQQEKEFAQERDSLIASNGDVNSGPKSKPAPESSFTQSLSSLPSSFTTLILSVVDSPAYANLTSHYLNDIFNPNTPDDPRVKYFSVAGRMSARSVSILHPFWLPKMVLDGVEEKERERLKKLWEDETVESNRSGETPFWADERQWGNDGLVTVQSAKWGEFLGTMEGCDHWEMRGARGIEFGVDIPAIPAIGLGSLPLASSLSNFKRPSLSTQPSSPPGHTQGDGWGFGDWTRFVGAWTKNKENEERANKAGTIHKLHKHSAEETNAHEAKMNSSSSSDSSGTSSRTDASQPQKASSSDPRVDTEDAVVKSSADTLSVVFDWLIDRVPAPAGILRRSSTEKESSDISTSGTRGSGSSASASSRMEVERDSDRTSDSEKDLSKVAVVHVVGVSSSVHSGSASAGGGAGDSGSNTGSRATVSSPPPSSPPSDMKRRMEKEDKGRLKRNELASREDLERFYVALTRKMYEEGL